MAGVSRIDPRDIENRRIGIVTVHKHEGKRGLYHRYLCRCECGKSFSTYRHSLVGKKHIESCGCLGLMANAARIAKLNLSHGLSRSSIYTRWRSMVDRCEKPANAKYNRYGGRGIRVCDRWRSFDNFLQDMGHPPSKAHSIDRIDVNGNYEPGNCRWATQKTQQNNRGNTRWIQYAGQRKRLTEWAVITGIPARIIRQRIDRDKWTIQKALTAPCK